ncbi:MAG: hypothetical protein NZ777_18225 [Pseudomonadales bacterium]|nr:hypothetical protein [Pseudomonadales bacterium]
MGYATDAPGVLDVATSTASAGSMNKSSLTSVDVTTVTFLVLPVVDHPTTHRHVDRGLALARVPASSAASRAVPELI